jgi:hypothetical protein
MNTNAEEEIFRRMTEDLDIAVPLINQAGAGSLTDIELVRKFNATKRELYARGELLNPKTDTGKDLGAIYHGCLLEMKKRGLM